MHVRWRLIAYVEVEANSHRVALGKPLEMIVVVFCNPELGGKIPFWTLSTLNCLVAFPR
jgi:hypothetical protein